MTTYTTDGRTQPGLSTIDPAIVHRVRDALRAQTAECVMATFGISVNTWVKMRDGKPIRTSVADRFLERLGAGSHATKIV